MKDLYIRLRELLDTMGIGFPSVPGKDIPYLKKIFTEEHASVFVVMENRLQPLEEIAGKLGRNHVELKQILEQMAAKGLVVEIAIPNITPAFYLPIPWLSGWGDWSAYYVDRETALLEHEYRKEAEFKGPGPHFKRNVFRTIPVLETISNINTVAPYDDARRLVEQAEKIAVSDCYCDRLRIARGETPYDPLERCLSFGTSADYTVANRFGRYVSPQEAIEILKKSADGGLVHNTGDILNPQFICNCGENCGGNISRRNVPWKFEEYEKTGNFYTTVDSDACSGCGECVDRCWFHAISMGSKGVCEINKAVCEGCGLCVTICPTKALTLREKPAAEHYTPHSVHPNIKSSDEIIKDLERYADIIKISS